MKEVAIVGDLILDRYVIGETVRVSPEAPVPVVKVEEEFSSLGGAGNVANNVVAMGGSVKLFGRLGKDGWGREFVKKASEQEIEVRPIYSSAPTTVKTRVIARNQQVVRVDREEVAPLSEEETDRLLREIEENFRGEVVVVSDYAKGVVGSKLLKELVKKYEVFLDPKPINASFYSGVFCMTPNKKEASVMLGMEISRQEDWKNAVVELWKKFSLSYAVITLGGEGIVGFDGHRVVHYPARTSRVYDVTGAGDAVIAALSLFHAEGKGFEDVLRLANSAGSVAVRKFGTRPVYRDEVFREAHSVDYKILRYEDVESIRVALRGKRVVFTNGCFDVLHWGHAYCLRKARELGDVLVVGLNSDDSVRRLKGDSRPIFDETSRARLLASLEFVDFVVIFSHDTPLELIKKLKPAVLVKGGDYEEKDVVGAEEVKSWGGEVVIVDYLPGFSSTEVINRFRGKS